MKKLLLGLGTLAAVAAPVASVIACGSESSGYVKANDAQTAALESLGAVVKDLLFASTSPTATNADRKVIATDINGDNWRFTIDLNASSKDNKTIARVYVSKKDKRIFKVEQKKDGGNYKDTTQDFISMINANNLTSEISNAATGLEVSAEKPSADDFAVGKPFDAKAMAGLLLKVGITMPEIRDSGNEQIDAEQNEALNQLIHGGFTIRAMATGKGTDEFHNSNDYAILLENLDVIVPPLVDEDVKNAGKLIDVNDKASGFEDNWGSDFTNKIGNGNKEQFILYIQDSQVPGAKQGSVDIFGDLVATAGDPNKAVDKNTYDTAGNTIMVDAGGNLFPLDANGVQVLPGGKMPAGAKEKLKSDDDIKAEIAKLPTIGTVLVTELKYDGKAGGFGADFDFILQSTRTTK